jgi:galactosylceramidase
MDAQIKQTVTFKIVGEFSTKPITVWRSILNEETFARQERITPKDGIFTIELKPKALYSLTTTVGQQKGKPQSPKYKSFPLPYYADFEDEQVGRSPRYFSDISGVFEVVKRSDGKGKCLQQTVNRKNIFWPSAEPSGDKAYNSTIIGEREWSDYRISTDVFLDEPGTAMIFGRLGGMNRATEPPNGYWLEVSTIGRWNFYEHKTKLASGKLRFPEKTWHKLQVEFTGNTVSASINGTRVCNVNLINKEEGFNHGLVGIGSGYNRALFDNFAVENIRGRVSTLDIR